MAFRGAAGGDCCTIRRLALASLFGTNDGCGFQRSNSRSRTARRLRALAHISSG
jgi:hypothetical protein